MHIMINEFIKENGYTYMSFSSERTEAEVSVGPFGVRVLNKNASHRVWGGLGRHFASFEEAKAGYKSSAMKAIINAAENLSKD